MKKGLISFLVLFIFFSVVSTTSGDVNDKIWEYKQIIEVTEKAGIPRLSHPVVVRLSMEHMNPDASDIRVTDKSGNLIPYQIISKNNKEKLILIRIGVDLPANGTEKYSIFYGNKNANQPLQTHAGVEKYLGNRFVTYAWGEVKISSYSPNNQITIEDSNGNFLKDAKTGVTFSSEISGSGSGRYLRLKEPTMITIKSTGLCTVAVGNFGKTDGDTTAFIPNASYCYIYTPSTLAITSLHDQNTVRIHSKGKLVKNEILYTGQTLYLDNLSQSFCKIETDKSCVIQYGSNPTKSVFSVPQKGLKYSYMPIGKVLIASSFDNTKIDISWSEENRLAETITLNKGEHKVFTNPIPTGGEILKATTITSSRPITVFAMGENSDGSGATFLPSVTGVYSGTSWRSFTGPTKAVTGERYLSLIQPFSQGKVLETGSLFFSISGDAVQVTSATVPGSYSHVTCSFSEVMLMLDGRPGTKSAFFQVPTVIDDTVSMPTFGNDPKKVEANSGLPGWMPEGKQEIDVTPTDPNLEPDPEPPAEDNNKSGIKTFIGRIFKSISKPSKDPIAFTIFLVFVTALLLLGVGLFSKFSGKDEDDEFLKTSFDDKKTEKPPVKKIITPEAKEEPVKQVTEIKEEPKVVPPPPAPKPETETVIKHIEPEIVQPKPTPPPAPPPIPKITKKHTEVGSFKTPKLRAPNLSQFMTKKLDPTPPPPPQPKIESRPIQEVKPKPVEPAPLPAPKEPELFVEEPEQAETIAEPAIEKSDLFTRETVESTEEITEEPIKETKPEPIIEKLPTEEAPKPIPRPREEKKISKVFTPPPSPLEADSEIQAVAEVVGVTQGATLKQKELADKLNLGGLVADAGVLVRLHHDGLIHLFEKIYISHTASILLPEDLLTDHRLEKVTVMGKDAVRADKLASDYGIFPEASRALVVAEKTKVKYYLTSAKLPQHLGKLNIIHVERFS